MLVVMLVAKVTLEVDSLMTMVVEAAHANSEAVDAESRGGQDYFGSG